MVMLWEGKPTDSATFTSGREGLCGLKWNRFKTEKGHSDLSRQEHSRVQFLTALTVRITS